MREQGPIRVLVVDDHRMFAEAIEMLLAGEEDLRVIDVVATGEDAIDAVTRFAPDVVLMDMDLPGIDGIAATRRIREMSDTTYIVMITAYQEPAVMARAIEAGACGFVPKTQAADKLVAIIRRAASGEVVLPAAEMRSVLAELQEAHRIRTNADRMLGLLTSREIEILQGIADGRSTTELAQLMHISPFTVQTHVKNILFKLGVHSKLEAVTTALRHGLIRISATN